ncbi:polysaccharide deacetylase family protein [Clostridium sp. SM-530-WT-3G]|uniref:polysaccharide deacetylase family protein n=1 Tax=Clostridium sp. SM-530-WT-3G TaxID=2725303 RepID=UPI00145D0BE0|nr:polysaccharide deacetylase family protein [Clostridium sp. SM-530-WT-3G]NME83118.1 polysaccharide deacetylase family protein [Clostridium sp. SM-530-WT-3G]
MFKRNLLLILSLLIITIFSGSFIMDSKVYTLNTNESNNISAENSDTGDEIKDNSYNNTDTEDEFNYSKNYNDNSSITLVNDNRGIPVLYYHSVNDSVDNEVTISPSLLKKELEYIKNQGYTTLSLKEVENYILNNQPIPEKSILITFDDGYMDNYYNAYPILKELNMKATIFCITSELDGSYYLSEDAIKEMSKNNIDIESHTLNHPHLNSLTYDEQLKELTESKAKLENITGNKITAIAFPFGDYNEDSIKAAKNSGYTLAFTTNKGFASRDNNPLELDRIYVSSYYDMDTFISNLEKTQK